MTFSPIQPLLASEAHKLTSVNEGTAPQPKATAPAELAEKQRVAREFEAIFLRQLLKPLDQAGQLTKSESATGQAIYGSMMVSALADQVAQAGGIGLAELILQALDPATVRVPGNIPKP